jgi:glycosyltransferase involved in cell wall biosynthesis
MPQVSSPPRNQAADVELHPPGVKHHKVSLCIPAYQAEQYLQATIDSVLAQTYADLEIVIVDNGSSDGTPDIVSKVDDDRVRVIRNPTTLPMVDNFNLAVKHCRGEFVKLVCADDLLEPDCVAAQLAVLDDNPGVSLVAARTDFIDDEGKLLRRARGLGGVVGRRTGERVVRRIVRSGSNPVGSPVAVMFRRADFERSGGFCGDLLFPMDMDLWVRLLRCGDFYGLPRTLAAFRIRSGSTTGLTSARSQLAQQTEFARRLMNDPRWHVSAVDRLLGWVNSYDMQLRRTLLFALSSRRAGRRRQDAT